MMGSRCWYSGGRFCVSVLRQRKVHGAIYAYFHNIKLLFGPLACFDLPQSSFISCNVPCTLYL